MIGTDGVILPGGIVCSSDKDSSDKKKLIPLKTVRNIYRIKRAQESKRKFLKPLENESLKQFSRRVDFEKRCIMIERDREAFKNKKSQKNKLKYAKRESRKKNRTMANDDNEDTFEGIESKYNVLNTNRPLFGDIVDSPPTFSPNIKEKLNKSKRPNNNRTDDLSDYIEHVRKAYFELKQRQTNEKNKNL